MSSDDRQISQTPLFGRKIKKFRKNEKAELDKQVKVVIGNPEIGEEKRGDLQGIRVHTDRHQRLEMLMAYRFDESGILLITIGSHENYYRDLKSYLD